MVLLTPPISWTNFWGAQVPNTSQVSDPVAKHLSQQTSSTTATISPMAIPLSEELGVSSLRHLKKLLKAKEKSNPTLNFRISMPETYPVSAGDSLPLAEAKIGKRTQITNSITKTWPKDSTLVGFICKTLPSIPCLRLIESLTPQKV